MKIILCLLIAITTYHTVVASDSMSNNKSHSFFISARPQYYLNKTGYELSTGTVQNMNIANTIGYEAGIGYEYKNRKNITYTLAANYGTQKHDVTWIFNLVDYVPNVTFDNNSLQGSMQWKTSYLNATFSVGYNIRPKKINNISFHLKAGVGMLAYLNSFRERRFYKLSYTNQAGDTTFINTLTRYNVEFGSDVVDGSFITSGEDFWDIDFNPVYNLYIGSIYSLKKSKIIKYLALGIEYTSVVPVDGKNTEVDYIFSRNFNHEAELVSIERFSNKLRSLNMVFTIGI